MGERIFYAASMHDEAEIEAVTEVLRGGAAALWPGRNVTAFEWAVAERFGKQRGLMCNSGSSALYLAVELADLPPGSEVITAAVDARSFWLAVIAMLAAVVAAFLYLRIVVAMFLEAPKSDAPRLRIPRGPAVAVAIVVLFTLAFGIYPEPLLNLADDAWLNLRLHAH